MVPGRKYDVRFAVRTLRRRWWVLILPLLVTGSIAVWLARALPDVYYAQSTIQVIPPRVGDNLVKGQVQLGLPERLQMATQQALTPPQLEQLVDEFDVYPTVRGRVPKDATTAWFRASIRVQPVKSDVFIVGYYGYSRSRVQKIAERLQTLMLKEATKQHEALADNTGQFFQSELETARKRLEEQEARVADYRRRYAGQLPSQVETNLKLMQGVGTELQGIEEAVNRDRTRREELSNELQTVSAAQPAPADDPEVPADPPPGDVTATLPVGPPIKQLRAARALRAKLARRFQPDFPDMQALDRAIAELERQVAATPAAAASESPARVKQLRDAIRTLDAQIAGREAAAQKLRDTITAYRTRVDMAPEREAEWTRLTRDYNTLQGVYQGLLAKREETRIAASLDHQSVGEQMRILEQPKLPGAPVSPKRKQIALIGAAIGAVLGILLLVLGELRDGTIRTEEEVLGALNLPVVGLVPMIVTTRDRFLIRRRRLIWSAAAVVLGAGLAFLRWHR